MRGSLRFACDEVLDIRVEHCNATTEGKEGWTLVITASVRDALFWFEFHTDAIEDLVNLTDELAERVRKAVAALPPGERP